MFDNLGDYQREVSTRSINAQPYFDQGLTLYFGFNHEEAIRSFEQVSLLDPECAMAPWGVALALGPNINNPAMDEATSLAAHEAVQRAIVADLGYVERVGRHGFYTLYRAHNYHFLAYAAMFEAQREARSRRRRRTCRCRPRRGTTDGPWRCRPWDGSRSHSRSSPRSRRPSQRCRRATT
jgi:hypothetical protein